MQQYSARMFAKLIGLMPDFVLKAIYYELFAEMVKRKHLMIVRSDVTRRIDGKIIKSMELKINE